MSLRFCEKTLCLINSLASLLKILYKLLVLIKLIKGLFANSNCNDKVKNEPT